MGMLFIGSGGAGHWGFVDLEVLGVRELLGSCAAVNVSSSIIGLRNCRCVLQKMREEG